MKPIWVLRPEGFLLKEGRPLLKCLVGCPPDQALFFTLTLAAIDCAERAFCVKLVAAACSKSNWLRQSLPMLKRSDGVKLPWRRRRDSNPRYRIYQYDGLANRWFQPLTHVSSAFGMRGL